MIKIDLHTHSTASHDGGISYDQYKQALESKLDYIAITDHNRIDFALYAQESLGDRIIVGEEIMTQSGEIVGLYLKHKITPFQSLGKTIEQIKSQDGIVYVPHPFEKIRKGISATDLAGHIGSLDIIESYNGRALNATRFKQATKFAEEHSIMQAASSDSHGWIGWGGTYSLINAAPTRLSLLSELSNSKIVYKSPRLASVLYPKYNKIKKALS